MTENGLITLNRKITELKKKILLSGKIFLSIFNNCL